MAQCPPPRSISWQGCPESVTSTLYCCCGRVDCVFLKKNCSILETVEKDVHTAAQLGQALLARHEAYMADAERDRLELTDRIEKLERDKQGLEAANADKIEENRSLLDQLEALNSTISDSDTKIKVLEASLLSSQQAVRRLEAAAARAADAERHIAVLEEEQAKLHLELRSTRDDARTHAQRFKEAQRGILDMQDQLERMEEEARQENQRHAEVIGRMERQREIDRQLDTAAGRIKGAAATKTLQEQKSSNKIVGHFVRDLLEDNANLQLAMAELREMLMSSNDEIQLLRDQIMHHQPICQDDDGPPPTLKDELETAHDMASLSQELHIHHHYHQAVRSPRKQDVRKPRKRRHGFLPTACTSPATLSPKPSAHWAAPVSSPAAPALLSATVGETTLVAPRPRHSWGGMSSMVSDFSSSAPNSPPSKRASVVFDQAVVDADGVASPATSFDPMSPTWGTIQSKRSSGCSSRSFQSMSMSVMEPGPVTPCGKQPARHAFPENTIHEEDEDEDGSQELGKDAELVVDASEDQKSDATTCVRLLRAPSHESIMSLAGGLEIHTLRSRPSQMTLRRLGGADAVVTGVTARPTLSHASGKRSDVALRDHFAGLHSPRSVSSPQRPSPGSSPASVGGAGTFGRLVGWRLWPSGGSRPSSPLNLSKPPDKDKDKDVGRVPGINQPGAIPGFQHYWAAQKRKGAPAQVTASVVDQEALHEGLQE
ncbi:hypothetical protein L249_0524 [Ophiocordyceps polyrhachis-furcata BCC 54312]|uniref:Uncharacterized protein n=1 Tax=Ophiocordyceps polyrhachis-furcata BCC 54312 TaxID=1330021 RepID=A0A367LEA3_9HYPO|nr:hypothetical protein L249_0524 [Ophiocordyceps polyrhachis-furcata BCC 54312]